MFRPLAAAFGGKIGCGPKSNGIHISQILRGPCSVAYLRELPDFCAEHILDREEEDFEESFMHIPFSAFLGGFE